MNRTSSFSSRQFYLQQILSPQVNGKSFQGLFHDEVVRILREVSGDVCIVCSRKSTGPSPLRGTIVDNVDTGKSVLAFASRVSFLMESFRFWSRGRTWKICSDGVIFPNWKLSTGVDGCIITRILNRNQFWSQWIIGVLLAALQH